MCRTYDLSYQVDSVAWNGSVITRGDNAAFEKRLDTLLGCGINQVMLSGYTDVEEADFDMIDETRRVGDMLRARGMEASQHHGLAATFAENGSSQDAVIEKLVRSVHYAANANSRVLVIHPGRVDLHCDTTEEYGEHFFRMERGMGRARLMEICAANLDAAGEEAGRLGVRIGIENAEIFNSDITLMKDLLGAVTSPHVGFCFDSGHAHCSGVGVLDWLEAFGDRLVTTHFHDNHGDSDEHLPPGFGTIPWIGLIQALRRHEYVDTVTFESGGWVGDDEKEGYPAAIGFWRACERYASLSEV